MAVLHVFSGMAVPLLIIALLKRISYKVYNFFKVHEFRGLLSNHCKISIQLPTGSRIHSSEVNLHKLQKIKWSDKVSLQYQEAIQDSRVLEAVKSLSSEVHTKDINALVDGISTLLVSALPKQKAPARHRKKRRSKSKKWYDQECKDLRTILFRLNRYLNKNPWDAEHRENFFKTRKEYKKLLKYKEKQFRISVIQKINELKSSDTKQFWNLVSDLKELESEKKTKVKSDVITADRWFNHFQNLLCAKKRNIDASSSVEEMINILRDEPFFNKLDFAIQEKEIKKAISCLKNGKAAGLDGINNEMIKISQSTFLPLYTSIFNKILNTGVFPAMWSKGYITPLHKSGSASDPDNYRGIMINICLSKVFTSIINNRLYDFFVDNGIISEFQIGFMKDSQTSDHMLVLKTLIDKYINNQKGGLHLCFVDFKKAYDSVWRDGLFYKLLKSGVRGKTFNVIQSMYSQSECCIKINGDRTDFMSDSIGVKQGEVLSPLLFNLFINDLVDVMNVSDSPSLNDREIPCLLYADDLVLIYPSAEGLQKKLDALHQYCEQWHLDVNVNKTKVMRVTKGGKNAKNSFNLGNTQLENT